MRYGYGYFEEEHLGKVGDLGLWRRLMSFAFPHRYAVGAAVFLSLVVIGATLTLPHLIRLGVDRFIINTQLEMSARLAGIKELALVFSVVIVVGFLANFSQVTLLEWTGQNIMHRMRQRLFTHLLGLHLSFFHNNPTGKLVTRLTNDIQNMHEMFTSVIVTVFNDFVRIGAILAILAWMNWRLALVVSLLVPVMAVNTLWFSKVARDAFRAIRTRLARINSFLQEILSGLVVVQLFLREKDSIKKFSALNTEYLAKTLYQIKIFGIFMPMIEVLSAVATALIIWYGGGEIIRERMSLGVLIAFLSYMRLFFQPLREISQKYSIVQSAMASAERIFQLMDTRSPLPVARGSLRPEDVHGRIVFDRVTFGYAPGQPVLTSFSLRIEPGETLAVVGATGAGKSSLVNLLERFYDPQEGKITIDGMDIRQLDTDWLRRHIGLVMQEVFMVPGTIRENIMLGEDMGVTGLEEIIARAQLTDLINRLPQGLETRVGEGGMELSAGQRQLIAFARVLARDPAILILDEATANVDSETEILVERAIDSALADRTSIVIAHRLSTIRRADRIVVLDKGRIVEQGSHDGLMAEQGFYFHLQRQQNGEG